MNLVPYIVPETELDAQIRELEEEIKSLQEALAIISADKLEVMDSLKSQLHDLVELRDRLSALLDTLEWEARQQESKDQGSFGPDQEVEEEIKERHSSKKGKANHKIRRKCKAIWSRIASLCHPDKVGKQQHLIDIYVEAKTAYDALNIVLLEELLLRAKSISKSKRRHTKKEHDEKDVKINILTALRNQLLDDYDFAINDVYYAVYQMYKDNGELPALNMLANMIQGEINITQHKISVLEAQSKQYMPRRFWQ